MTHFVKAHACGNDFLILDEPVEASRYAEVARKLCARSTGIGADGVEYLTLDPNGGYAIRLFNADGSEAEISGNGTRCVAAYLAQTEDSAQFSIRTHAGLRRCQILERDPPRYRISTRMGIPEIETQKVLLSDRTLIDGLHVSIGNPHFVIFIESQDFQCFGRDWRQVGEEISTHKDFPEGTNVEFVREIDSSRIEFRIYERGAGPTQSSGTGTCASAAAGIRSLGLARSLVVLAEGGEQTVDWPDDPSEMVLTGPAEIIAEGECLLI